MRIFSVVGTRSDVVNISPLIREMRRHPSIVPVLVHTDQFYGGGSERFFRDLDLAPPDFNLGVGSGSDAQQTAEVMRRLEPILDSTRPDVVLVVGDANYTLGTALTAAKLGISVAHVDAGLRSFDRTAPEEINRRLTDIVADLLFVTEESAEDNLRREGVAPERIHRVGNVVIDALHAFRAHWEAASVFERLKLDAEDAYIVVTLQQASVVDDPLRLMNLLDALDELARQVPIIFPLHPRVKQTLFRQAYMAWTVSKETAPRKGISYIDPLGYLDFIALLSRARLVLTDSGGIQEQTSVLGVPCLTLRNATERPFTVTHGTNRVIGPDPDCIVDEALSVLEHPPRPTRLLPAWDGRASERIVKILIDQPRGARCV